MCDLSRERVRQLEKQLTKNLQDPSGPVAPIVMIANLVGPQIGPITTKDKLELRIAETFPDTQEIVVPEDAHNQSQHNFDATKVVDLARQMLRRELNYFMCRRCMPRQYRYRSSSRTPNRSPFFSRRSRTS